MNTKFFATFTMTAALAVAASVTAFAMEGSTMKANISFPFRASSASMPAGSYEVVPENTNGTQRFYLRDAASHKRIVVVSWVSEVSKSAQPSLTFRCAEYGCGLTGINMGDGQTYKTPKPKYTPSENERLVTVNLERAAGE